MKIFDPVPGPLTVSVFPQNCLSVPGQGPCWPSAFFPAILLSRHLHSSQAQLLPTPQTRLKRSPCSCYSSCLDIYLTLPPPKAYPSSSIISPEMLHPQRMKVPFSWSNKRGSMLFEDTAPIDVSCRTIFYLCQYLSHSPATWQAP